jgi:hypothetical protein
MGPCCPEPVSDTSMIALITGIHHGQYGGHLNLCEACICLGMGDGDPCCPALELGEGEGFVQAHTPGDQAGVLAQASGLQNRIMMVLGKPSLKRAGCQVPATALGLSASASSLWSSLSSPSCHACLAANVQPVPAASSSSTTPGHVVWNTHASSCSRCLGYCTAWPT